MKSERWQQVEQLYHAALDRDAAERRAFLYDACAGDEGLRREVESLLGYEDDAEHFMEAPAAEVAAKMMTKDQRESLVGRRFGSYHILTLLGAGGMGEVYRARDTKLGRDVAIKVLPASFASDPERLRRFAREARLLAALNHPRIAAIHGFEETEGFCGLVLELVEGPSLAERVAAGPLVVNEALTIACQIADALEAAHAKGIIHRDLKPANIIVQGAWGPTPTRWKTAASSVDSPPRVSDVAVKVLDFGLAKVLAGASASVDLSQSPTVTATATREGMIVGTPAYMSPEQARGKPLGERTDIWSFGCVLYEMLTGGPAFTGETLSDTIAAILEREPPSVRQVRRDVPVDIEQVVMRCLKKDPAARFRSGTELVAELRACQTRLAARTMAVTTVLKRPTVAAAAILLVIVGLGTGVWWWTRAARVRWARDDAIPQIERLVEQDRYVAAYDLAQKAEAYLPDDRILRELWPEFATTATLVTSLDGADISFREYRSTDGDWRYLGRSPLKNIRLPRGTFRWKIERTGFATLELATADLRGTINFPVLTESTHLPRDMVLVPGGHVPGVFLGVTGLNSPAHNAPLPGPDRLDSYLIDRYEVTNRQFKEFVDGGGYGNPRYWTQPFIKAGRHLSWDEAMAEFRDSTGRPGPATWELGDYPRGQDEYPVGGVSWYEAAAYAEFRGKQLPTIYHWSGAGLGGAELAGWDSRLLSSIVAGSNFAGKGPAAVGGHTGIGMFGTYDMAGNLREWCWNAAGDQRWILGGSWNDQSYMFSQRYFLPPFDRSPQNGFRLVKYLDRDPEPSLTAPLDRPQKDFRTVKSVSDEVFDVFRRQYSLVRSALNSRVEAVDDTAEWTREKISFDAGYGGERTTTYVFLPKQSRRPYQAVVLFGGVGPWMLERPSVNIQPTEADFVLKSGRALVLPVFKGSYERYDGFLRLAGEEYLRAFREHMNHWRQDLGRTIDYLQSRPEIDAGRVAWLGHSLGVGTPASLLALEERIKVAVLISGGLPFRDVPPEADQVNYLPRTKIPVLLISGNYDSLFPVETSQKPLLTFLGTDPRHKRHVIVEGGHGISQMPRAQVIRETLAWLDQYLGQAK